MERKKIKDELLKFYKPLTVTRILQGVRKPRYEVMVELDKRGIVKFEAWLDIKSYLNDNIDRDENSNTTVEEKVS